MCRLRLGEIRDYPMSETVHFILHHGYAVLAVWVFAEQFGFPISSIPVLLAAGALAGTGNLGLAGVLLFPVVGSLIADGIWYEIGRYKGSKVLNVLCRISLEPDSCVRNTENLFARRGAKALVAAKFVPGFSIVAPPLAGMLGMRISRFLLFDGMGALAYIGSFVGLGYVFSRQLEDIARVSLRLGTGLLALLAVGLALYIVWKYAQRQRFLRKLRISRITPEELKQKMDANEDLVVVDLRHSMDFGSDPATIPGALYLPSEEFEHRYKELPVDKELVLYCT
jgi:membrane protein DedA with SNARE-associated domain